MMLALDHREVFERAISASSFMRRNGGKDWSAFELTNVSPDSFVGDASAKRKFIAEALAILEVPPGRKHEADWYEAVRQDPITGEESRVTQATVYVEERPESSLAFGENDLVEMRMVPRVGELGFSYDPKDGVVEICAAGKKTQRDRYAQAFAECFFDESPVPVEVTRRAINFAQLSKESSFDAEPGDRIERYEFSELAFYSEGGGFARFERRDENESIYQFIERRFGDSSPLSAPGWRMTAATLRIVRNPVDGKGRKKTLTIDLKSPNRTTLRNKVEEDRIFVTDLLTRWGVLSPPADDVSVVEPF